MCVCVCVCVCLCVCVCARARAREREREIYGLKKRVVVVVWVAQWLRRAGHGSGGVTVQP